MKRVTVYSTVGQQKHEVTVSANNWGELQRELSEHGVGTSGMKAVIGESQVTLESNQAEVPSNDFTLFLLPQKVKSGSYWGKDEDCDCEDESEDVDGTLSSQIKSKIQEIGQNVNDLYELALRLESENPQDISTKELRDRAEQIKKNFGIWD